MGKKTFGILSTVLKSSKATGLITLDQATHSTYYLGSVRSIRQCTFWILDFFRNDRLTAYDCAGEKLCIELCQNLIFLGCSIYISFIDE